MAGGRSIPKMKPRVLPEGVVLQKKPAETPVSAYTQNVKVDPLVLCFMAAAPCEFINPIICLEMPPRDMAKLKIRITSKEGVEQIFGNIQLVGGHNFLGVKAPSIWLNAGDRFEVFVEIVNKNEVPVPVWAAAVCRMS